MPNGILIAKHDDLSCVLNRMISAPGQFRLEPCAAHIPLHIAAASAHDAAATSRLGGKKVQEPPLCAEMSIQLSHARHPARDKLTISEPRQDVEPDGRRQPNLQTALRIDLCGELIERFALRLCNVSKRVPKRILK